MRVLSSRSSRSRVCVFPEYFESRWSPCRSKIAETTGDWSGHLGFQHYRRVAGVGEERVLRIPDFPLTSNVSLWDLTTTPVTYVYKTQRETTPPPTWIRVSFRWEKRLRQEKTQGKELYWKRPKRPEVVFLGELPMWVSGSVLQYFNYTQVNTYLLSSVCTLCTIVYFGLWTILFPKTPCLPYLKFIVN